MPAQAALWSLSAAEVAAAVRHGDVSCREVTASVLERIAQCNPRVNALTEVLADAALASADAADRARAAGAALGPLHGVPVTIKINVDQAGHATSNGVIPLRDHIAREDAPLVAQWRAAGAIIVGRSNTPTYSWRWFTDNGLHGRTLNPWDPAVTPGGSSGGAAAAVATGMGALAHGNDIGGSIRYPAYACGVAGLRPTVGRVPAYNPSATAERSITPQLMSVQGPLARSVGDLRLGFHAMAGHDARDPSWVPVPLELPLPAGPLRVALFRHCPGIAVDPAVSAALDQAAGWLQAAGYVVEEAALPGFLEAAELWRTLTTDDARRSVVAGVREHGDEAIRRSLHNMMEGMAETDRDGFLDGLARRQTLARQWAVFFERYPLVLMPVSWQRPVRQDMDTGSVEDMRALVAAQSPLLATAGLGVPGLSVPTGLAGGVPMGVQLVAWRFREDLLLRAGEVIERAAGFLPFSAR
ncbi:amidase [Cupriavidus sp. USMAA2-4]|uniref:Amidase n=1 Tax=Cupriavidus malaysiensis TaxID=367825 RepID=A0ABN4TT60_9BURK|nr:MULTISPECIES: amidase family protein [Cupriavidus]AOY94953.1 amidase [Cupriavidus sp. USMAA2-4]AOZ02168.1 amidase [Cupriavidus sp. USMAHM13]AOZ10452.1 amidase [Cupriavidus malaysiensis]